MVLNPFHDSILSEQLAFQADATWQIRSAKIQDLAALAELERICFRRPWSKAQLTAELAYPERSFFFSRGNLYRRDKISLGLDFLATGIG